MLFRSGFTQAKIVASSDLDEYTIMNLKAQGAKIDTWGVGTKLITAYDQAALGAVYKIVAIEGADGEMEDTIKISSNPEKVTTPGIKKVYRIINKANQHSEGDYITMENENPQEETRLKMFHPVHTFISKFVTNFDARELHYDIFKEGALVYVQPPLEEVRDHSQFCLGVLWEEYTRLLNPEEYPVDLSQKCWNNKMRNIEEVRDKVAEMTAE